MMKKLELFFHRLLGLSDLINRVQALETWKNIPKNTPMDAQTKICVPVFNALGERGYRLYNGGIVFLDKKSELYWDKNAQAYAEVSLLELLEALSNKKMYAVHFPGTSPDQKIVIDKAR